MKIEYILIAVNLLLTIYLLICQIKRNRAMDWSKPKKDWRSKAWIIEKLAVEPMFLSKKGIKKMAKNLGLKIKK